MLWAKRTVYLYGIHSAIVYLYGIHPAGGGNVCCQLGLVTRKTWRSVKPEQLISDVFFSVARLYYSSFPEVAIYCPPCHLHSLGYVGYVPPCVFEESGNLIRPVIPSVTNDFQQHRDGVDRCVAARMIGQHVK